MPAARAALERFARRADGVDLAERLRLARTVPAWQAESPAGMSWGWPVCSTGGDGSGERDATLARR